MKSLLDIVIEEARTKLQKLPHEEVVCIAMLLGEYQPIRCSCCRGKGSATRLWGVKKCSQCNGIGYDMIGPKTLTAVLDGVNY